MTYTSCARLLGAVVTADAMLAEAVIIIISTLILFMLCNLKPMYYDCLAAMICVVFVRL